MRGTDDHRRAAARAALAELPRQGVIGLGSGTTIGWFLEALGEAIRAGRQLAGVASSEATRTRARELGIPLLGEDGPWPIAVAVDGADEVDDALDLIKGGGGAMTREKIVSASAARNVIVIDDSKLSSRLGERRPIPIEVLSFGHLATKAHLSHHGEPLLREHAGMPVRSDSGNLIYDLHVSPIADVRTFERVLHAIPGVIETGLFVGRADVVLVGSSRGVIRRERTSAGVVKQSEELSCK
jgi:ribose 5-phosphate isomerase A